MDNISFPTPMGDANPTTGAAAGGGGSEGGPQKKDDNVSGGSRYYERCGYPDFASQLAARRLQTFFQYSKHVSAQLYKALDKDSVNGFLNIYDGWKRLMIEDKFLRPEILHAIIARNAMRCAKAALEGHRILGGRRADPNVRSRHGFMPLHSAAEVFSLQMVELLLKHGASANVRTEGELVIEGLLPLHVAVENTAMHKYLVDNWAPGHHVKNLVFLLCLPEMKMFLDTTRLIAKHTDNIVEEVWIYIKNGKIVHAAILLLAAQKQLHDHMNCSEAKVVQNGFGIVRSRISNVVVDLHIQCLNMVSEGKNGKALRKLKEKEDTLLSAKIIVDIVHKAGEALEGCIQNHSEHLYELVANPVNFVSKKISSDDVLIFNSNDFLVSREDVLERVSSILSSCGIVSAINIDSENFDCYHYYGDSDDESRPQREDAQGTNEAHKSSSLEAEHNKMVMPPKGLALRNVRNKFFPYWKSVLSARIGLKLFPPIRPSMIHKRSIHQLCSANKPMENFGMLGRPKIPSNYEYRRLFSVVASMTLRFLKR